MSTSPATMLPESSLPASRLRRVVATIRGLLLWRHERGSWQYDVMVALILIFVLASPRSWFHDLPVPRALPEAAILVWQKTPEVTQYRIPASLLRQYGEQPEAAVRALLAQRHGKPFTITGIEPVEDDAGAIVWYDVWTRNKRD